MINMCIVYFFKWSFDWNIIRLINVFYYLIIILSNSKFKMFYFLFLDKCYDVNIKKLILF